MNLVLSLSCWTWTRSCLPCHLWADHVLTLSHSLSLSLSASFPGQMVHKSPPQNSSLPAQIHTHTHTDTHTHCTQIHSPTLPNLCNTQYEYEFCLYSTLESKKTQSINKPGAHTLSRSYTDKVLEVKFILLAVMACSTKSSCICTDNMHHKAYITLRTYYSDLIMVMDFY